MDDEDLGRVILSTPDYPRTYIIGLTGFAVALLVTSAVMTVPSEIRLPGRIAPIGGLATVNTPASATVERILVRPGDAVKRGQHLILLGRSMSIGSINIDEQLTKSNVMLDSENAAISQRTVSGLKLHIQDLVSNLSNIDRQIDAERSRQKIISQKSILISQTLKKEETLVERGFISKVQFDNLQSRRLDLQDDEVQGQQRILSLQKEREGFVDDISNAKSSIDIERHKGLLAKVASYQTRLDVSRSEYYIDSPMSGTILDIRATRGQTSAAGAILAVIGSRSPLGIEVYIPAKLAARVQPGQRATAVIGDENPLDRRIITGRVIAVSGTSADAQAFQNPELEAKVSYFRAVIALTGLDQQLKKEGSYSFRVGSSIEIDVHTGAETFLHWAFSH